MAAWLLLLLLSFATADPLAPTRRFPLLRRLNPRSPSPPPLPLLASLSRKQQEEARNQDIAAAAWVGGLALASEVMQFVNTAAVVFVFQRMTGSSSALHMVDALTDAFSRLGYGAYPAYALMLIGISVLPLMSALLFIFVAGMVFGPVGWHHMRPPPPHPHFLLPPCLPLLLSNHRSLPYSSLPLRPSPKSHEPPHLHLPPLP